ncbi:MAG: hypothetical protein ACOC54_04835, partial [Candidatus Sumerlaeota bacterium]
AFAKIDRHIFFLLYDNKSKLMDHTGNISKPIAGPRQIHSSCITPNPPQGNPFSHNHFIIFAENRQIRNLERAEFAQYRYLQVIQDR